MPNMDTQIVALAGRIGREMRKLVQSIREKLDIAEFNRIIVTKMDKGDVASEINEIVAEGSTDIVTISGNQTITGKKVFTSDTKWKRTWDATTVPSSVLEWWPFFVVDKNSKEMSGVGLIQGVYGEACSFLRTVNQSAGSNLWADIGIRVNADKSYYAYLRGHGSVAFNLPGTDRSNKLPTTSWVGAYFLPLTGGTLSGSLTATNYSATTGGYLVDNIVNDTYRDFCFRKDSSHRVVTIRAAVNSEGTRHSLTLGANTPSNSAPNGITVWREDADAGIGLDFTTTVNAAMTVKGDVNSTGAFSTSGDSLRISAPVTKGTNPTAIKWGHINVYDNSGTWANNTLLSQYDTAVDADGNVTAYLRAFKYLSGSTDNTFLAVKYNADGTTFASAPSCQSSSGSTEIVTLGYLQNNYLKLSGGTCTGGIRANYLSGYPRVYIYTTGRTKGSNPSTDQQADIVFGDSSCGSSLHPAIGSCGFGQVSSIVNSSGTTTLLMQTFRNSGTSTASSKIQLDMTSSGVASCTISAATTVSSTLTATGAITGSSITASSDIRLKEDLVPVTTDLSSLTSYQYTLKQDGRKHVGLIAQEVEKILPEAVSENEEGYKALDYNAVVAVLVSKVNDLERRLKEIEE